MKIPEIFFGNKRDVRNKINTIGNRILKANLKEQLSKINCIDTDSLNEFIINYDDSGYYMNLRNCFYLSELSESIFHSDRFPVEILHKIRDENIEYLANTGWGNLLLNNPSNTTLFVYDKEYDYDNFVRNENLNRERCSIILNGMIEFHDEYVKLKDHIYSVIGKFPNISMLIYYIIGNCSIENYIYDKNIMIDKDNLLDICKKTYNEINDDNYWKNLIKKRQEKIMRQREKDKVEHKKRLIEEIEWYRNEMKKKES
jgi:hypothetical protein